MELYIVLAVLGGGGALYFAYKHGFLHGTVASAPAPAPAPVVVTVTTPSPAPVAAPVPLPPVSVVSPPDHAANPLPTVGNLVGQNPPGMSPIDADGCVTIPAIAAKFAPGTRFMTIAELPFVAAGSALAFAINANCQNAWFGLGMLGGNPHYPCYCLPAVANPASAAAVGGAAFHLLGQAYGEPKTDLPNAYAITRDLTTIDQIVAYYSAKPNWAPPNYAASPVAGG